MVQTKFVKYKTLKYFRSITQILDTVKICENYFHEIVNESKFVKYRALESNQLYGILLATCSAPPPPPQAMLQFVGGESTRISLVYTRVLTRVQLTSDCKPSSNPPMDVG